MIEFTDASRKQIYYVLRERTNAQGQPLRGLGTDLIISNGASADRSQSLTIRLADQYNQTFGRLNLSLRAGSCNQAGGPTRLCATTNIQGRFVNGSTDVCRQGVATVSGTERFIHLEQSCALRQISNCNRPASVAYHLTIDVFAAVFPCTPLRN